PNYRNSGRGEGRREPNVSPGSPKSGRRATAARPMSNGKAGVGLPESREARASPTAQTTRRFHGTSPTWTADPTNDKPWVGWSSCPPRPGAHAGRPRTAGRGARRHRHGDDLGRLARLRLDTAERQLLRHPERA